MDKITINTEYIKLQQALKLSNCVTQGSEAKIIISNGLVKVNGEVIFQRGKKIYPNDIISVDNFGDIIVKGA